MNKKRIPELNNVTFTLVHAPTLLSFSHFSLPLPSSMFSNESPKVHCHLKTRLHSPSYFPSPSKLTKFKKSMIFFHKINIFYQPINLMYNQNFESLNGMKNKIDKNCIQECTPWQRESYKIANSCYYRTRKPEKRMTWLSNLPKSNANIITWSKECGHAYGRQWTRTLSH